MTDAAAGGEPLLRERDGGVLVLTLNRPDVLNALDAALKRALLDALKAAGRDRDVRAVVLTGAGRAFSAGQDLRERRDGKIDYAATLRADYNAIVTAMRRLEKPIVAAVNGVAAGAGFSLALACDVRIAAEGATFAAAFGRVGLVPDSGMTWFLPRLVGPARAAEIVMLGEPVDAATAERVGLASRVVAPAELLAAARELAGRLAASSPLALALTKRALNRTWESDLEAALEHEAALQGIAGRSADHAEGVAAFREKRAPRFAGE